MYQFIADFILVVHLAFIAFVLAGGLLLLRWPRLFWLHLPAVSWTVFVELTGGVCPLTPLENYFRALGRGDVFQGDFVGRYLLPLVYPAALTPSIQAVLAGVVILINFIFYAVIIRIHSKAR
jgi:hypothetical protein